jgi:DHA1 family tetracycline resistance protein-like MFS transporter
MLDGVFGGQIPVIRAYISDITTPKTRAEEMSKIMVGHVVGMIIGPIIGGFLGAINWRYPAILASFLSIIAITLTLKVLIESMPKERIADIKLRLATNENSSDNNGRIWNKEVNLRFVQIFLLFMIFVQIFLLFMITVMVNSSFPLFLDNRYGAGPSIIGSVMSVAGIVVLIYAGILMKPMLRKFGEKRVLIFGFLLLIVIFLFFPYLTELWMV